MTPLVERLLGEQLPDGGWNREVENGATVSSVETTINVLEGLLVHERACTPSRWNTFRAMRVLDWYAQGG
ncbi:hypothetical protein BH20CHL7_BH20CHL7_13310 [soil metagenome]